MTELKKSVTRKGTKPHPRWQKPIVVMLRPGDVVSLRLERSTRTFHVPLDRLYDYAESSFARAALTGARS